MQIHLHCLAVALLLRGIPNICNFQLQLTCNVDSHCCNHWWMHCPLHCNLPILLQDGPWLHRSLLGYSLHVYDSLCRQLWTSPHFKEIPKIWWHPSILQIVDYWIQWAARFGLELASHGCVGLVGIRYFYFDCQLRICLSYCCPNYLAVNWAHNFYAARWLIASLWNTGR